MKTTSTNYSTIKYIFGLLIIILSNAIHAQDLIVTKENDSLNCKITKIKTDNIYFTFMHKDEIRSTLLPIADVKYHQYNFYKTSIVPADKVVDTQKYNHFRIAVNGGRSYRVGKIAGNNEPEIQQYQKELKSGYNLGIDMTYFISEPIGFGIKYSNFKSKNSMDDIYLTFPNGYTEYGKMSDNISISFIGPMFSTRLMNANKKNALFLNFGIGYMGYNNEAVLVSNYTMSGSTLGLSYDVGYDIGFSENFAVGFQFSFLMGTVMEYELSDGIKSETIKLDKDSYESLSRIDLSIGLRYNL